MVRYLRIRALQRAWTRLKVAQVVPGEDHPPIKSAWQRYGLIEVLRAFSPQNEAGWNHGDKFVPAWICGDGFFVGGGRHNFGQEGFLWKYWPETA